MLSFEVHLYGKDIADLMVFRWTILETAIHFVKRHIMLFIFNIFWHFSGLFDSFVMTDQDRTLSHTLDGCAKYRGLTRRTKEKTS